MEKDKIASLMVSPELMGMLLELNEEVERLKKFAKNVNTFGSKIYPDLVQISEDRK